jgi:hypothetical protein
MVHRASLAYSCTRNITGPSAHLYKASLLPFVNNTIFYIKHEIKIPVLKHKVIKLNSLIKNTSKISSSFTKSGKLIVKIKTKTI